jgi:hypothetical protein
LSSGDGADTRNGVLIVWARWAANDSRHQGAWSPGFRGFERPRHLVSAFCSSLFVLRVPLHRAERERRRHRVRWLLVFSLMTEPANELASTGRLA